MKSIICSCRFNLYQWRKNPRIICVFLLVFGYVFAITEPILKYCTYVQQKCTPWLLPFISSDENCILIFMFLFVVLLCDAPFLYPYQKYLIIRSGKIRWVLGQLLYVAVVAFLYWFFIALCSILLLIPNLELSTQWGKIIGTLAQVRVGSEFMLYFKLEYKILVAFTPINAFFISFFLDFLVSFFVGTIIFYFNMSKQKYFGVIIAFILIVMQHFAYMASGYWVYRISPVSWMSMNIINFTDSRTNMPSFPYVLICLFALSFLLIFLIIKKTKLRAIDLIS